MLEGIDPLLTGELLWRLDAMGHSDGIALVDAHYRHPRAGQPQLAFPGVGVTDLARAIGTVLPIDPEVAPTLMRAPDGPTDVQRELADVVGVPLGSLTLLDRYGFYDQVASSAIVVVRTGERRTYGNVILYKGIVGQAGA